MQNNNFKMEKVYKTTRCIVLLDNVYVCFYFKLDGKKEAYKKYK